nr:immunoglobulin light chain junction region [Macaca mulatta]MOX85018.1 immunoglobulin light chain junction region [Macaca mulatta]MOX85025.1 immunoglobulin light chain junction region [Macaca mulatta]MOX85553.1 immunoglobulin light chain junction region [Macaca mulatta]MOX86775.1 immunoglobulin light chain junction region [Macaca mulatta]
CQQHASSPLTF